MFIDMDIKFIISASMGLLTFFWTAYKYFDTRKRDQDLKEFENYHKLIKELVQPEDEKERMYVDRQTAILYELRNFKRYYPFSYRTLVSLKIKWEKVPGQFPRLLEELNLTINFLEKYKNKS
jgi:hypothetical protein